MTMPYTDYEDGYEWMPEEDVIDRFKVVIRSRIAGWKQYLQLKYNPVAQRNYWTRRAHRAEQRNMDVSNENRSLRATRSTLQANRDRALEELDKPVFIPRWDEERVSAWKQVQATQRAHMSRARSYLLPTQEIGGIKDIDEVARTWASQLEADPWT